MLFVLVLAPVFVLVLVLLLVLLLILVLGLVPVLVFKNKCIPAQMNAKRSTFSLRGNLNVQNVFDL